MSHVQFILAVLVAVGAAVMLGLLVDTGLIQDALRYLLRRRRGGVAARQSEPIDASASPAAPAVRTGKAATALRPFGRVVVAGVEYPAKSEFGFIAPGTPVTVTGTDGDVFVVRPDVTSIA